MIHFACPTCQSAFVVGEEKAGKRSRCPTCQQPLQVPESARDENGVISPRTDEGAQDDRLNGNDLAPDDSFIDSGMLDSSASLPARLPSPPTYVPPSLPSTVPFRPVSDAGSPFGRRGLLIGCAIGSVLGVGSCIGLVALFVSMIFAMTRPVVSAADEFLNLIGEGKIAEAYASTASELRSNQDEATFTTAVQQTSLAEFASVSWNSRSITNQEGRVGGTLTTKNGKTLPIHMRLVKEGDKWRVLEVRAGTSK